MGNEESVGARGGGGGKPKRFGRKKYKGPVVDPAVLEAYPDRKWDAGYVTRLINGHRLAPLTLGTEDPTTDHDEECPICFLNFSYGLNVTECCRHAICTKCFLTLQPHPYQSSAKEFVSSRCIGSCHLMLHSHMYLFLEQC